MAWPVLLLVLLTSGAIRVPLRRRRPARRERRDRREASLRALRFSRHAAHEDVGALGDRLADLTGSPVTEESDGAARDDLLRAGRAYADARRLLHDATGPDDVAAATRCLADGGRALAAGWARLAGRPVGQGWAPCFFNPRHGPADTSRDWAPAGCTPHEVPTCRECWDRLEEGLRPQVRDVLRGNRHVPWFQGGPDYGPYAEGYYGDAARAGRFPSFVVDAMLAPPELDRPRPAAHRDLAGWEGWAGVDHDDVADRPRRRTGLRADAAVDDLIQGFLAPDRGRPGRNRPG